MFGLSINCKCSTCGEKRARAGVIGSLRRRCTAKCGACGARQMSELSFRSYLLLILYTQIIVTFVGLPIVLGLAGGNWLVASVGIAAFLLLVLPVGVVLHART